MLLVQLFHVSNLKNLQDKLKNKSIKELKEIIKSKSSKINSYFNSQDQAEYYAASLILLDRGYQVPADNFF